MEIVLDHGAIPLLASSIPNIEFELGLFVLHFLELIINGNRGHLLDEFILQEANKESTFADSALANDDHLVRSFLLPLSHIRE